MKKSLMISVLAVELLSACGGGGGGGGSSGPVASTNSFNLQSGYNAIVQNGWSKTFSISGTCTGSISITRAAASTSTTFESVSALSSAETLTGSFTNCTPASLAVTETLYYNSSNYTQLGYSVLSGNYAVFATPPTIPTSVRVGDTAVIGTMNIYTNSSKTTSAGHQDLSYVVTADTASTAFITLISRIYDASSNLTSTEQDKYRIDASNQLTPVSLDILYSNGTHLIGN